MTSTSELSWMASGPNEALFWMCGFPRSFRTKNEYMSLINEIVL